MTTSVKDALARHFELNQLIESSYKQRNKTPDAINLCIQYCLEDIQSISTCVHVWLEEERKLGKEPPRLPRIPSFKRLAIIYENQEKYTDAIEICQHAIELGLDDPQKCYSPEDFANRIAKLKRKIDTQKPQKTQAQAVDPSPKSENSVTTTAPAISVQPQLHSYEDGIHVNWINGIKITSKSTKARYRSANGQSITIEELALEHYRRLGYTGFHSENDYWSMVMGLLFWDVIFAKLPGVFDLRLGDFPSKLQDIPKDLFTHEFYQKRRSRIFRRITDLTEPKLFGMLKPSIEKEIQSAFKKHYGDPCRIIQWEVFDLEKLILAANSLAPNQLMKIMQRLLEDYNHNRSGLPDLFLVNNDKVLFVEVKSEKEKVAEHQVQWLLYLQQKANVRVEICRVKT